MLTITSSYASQLAEVNISTIPAATFVKTEWDLGNHVLTGYVFGGTLYELADEVQSVANLAIFKAAAIAAIEADFLARFSSHSTLEAIAFTLAVSGLNVVANALSASIDYNANEEPTTQLKSFFALAFDFDTLVLAPILQCAYTDSVPAATTLLAQQGRQTLQIS